MKAPFPWFGGKSRVAHLVWDRIGNVPNYVEPFFGSGAVLLERPWPAETESVNDLDCMVANFWRALQHDPEGVAEAADGSQGNGSGRENAGRERIWFSPHCLKPKQGLFSELMGLAMRDADEAAERYLIENSND